MSTFIYRSHNPHSTSRWSKRPQMSTILKNSYLFALRRSLINEIYNNKSTALPFENHLQLLIMINKTRSFEITIDVSAIRHVVIFQANFGYSYLQCVIYFLLTNKFISMFSLQKSSFERAEQLSLSFSWRENLRKDEQN